MATSRAISPVSGSEPGSPIQLTPNSKVKAMLAALDNDSEEESTTAISRPSFLSSKAIITPIDQHSNLDAPSPAISHDKAQDSEEEDDDEDEIIKPRGRAAARVLAMSRGSDVEDNDVETSATDRVRELFTTKPPRSKSTSANRDRAPAQESSDDDVATASSRKCKSKRAQDATPQTSPVKSTVGSPGMFVSPAGSRTEQTIQDESDTDLPANPASNARFLELVAKKRREREALQAEELKKKLERSKKDAAHNRIIEQDEADDTDMSDDENGRRLTQTMRPTRIAGKRAMEEMARETQRMARNMQLAHQAKTKKKISKASLFARFNYKPEGFSEPESEETRRPGSSSSALNSDALAKETPPTSPLHDDSCRLQSLPTAPIHISEDNDLQVHHTNVDLPSLEDVLSAENMPSSPPVIHSAIDKGKARATDDSGSPDGPAVKQTEPLFKHRPIKVHPPKVVSRDMFAGSDSDSDLEFVPTKSPVKKSKIELKTDAVFARVPVSKARDSNSLHTLRMLAHLTSPGKQAINKKNAKKAMTSSELQISLQQRARQQAAREREERLQILRDRGVVVQTAEERAQEMAEVEDLMAKARREGEEIMKREQAAAKKERQENGEIDPLGTSSDDEDWEEEKEITAEHVSGHASENEDADIEISGSDDDEEDEDEEEGEMVGEDDEDAPSSNMLIDNEASETESEAESNDPEDSEMIDPFINTDEAEDQHAPLTKSRRRNRAAIISDDEDVDENNDDDSLMRTPAVMMKTPAMARTISPASKSSGSPIAPGSVLRSATKTFIPGLTVAGPAGLGLTQIFQGTMDDDFSQDMQDSPIQTRPDFQQIHPGQDSMAFLRNMPPPAMPIFAPTMAEDSQDVVPNSQTPLSQLPPSQVTGEESQGIQLSFSQSQVHGFDSMPLPATQQYSQFELTQDAGPQDMTPVKGRFTDPPHSTVETVLIAEGPQSILPKTQIPKKRGRLQRRTAIADFSSDEDDAEPGDASDGLADAFEVLRKASKPKTAITEFDKKKSGAKEMVQDQADESEDEYAGLGGNSDDDSGEEEDAYVKEMIDDEAGKDADERQIAAFHANKERQQDEKVVERLFRDITNGNLRKKRGTDYDLEDSDDDGEARRRMKQREFAKMRKALLADERIEKIAENPKSMAFLKAIEDRGSDDEMDFLEEFSETQQDSYSQSQTDESQKQNADGADMVPNSQPDISMAPPPKRKFDGAGDSGDRLPPHLRRTQGGKKPSNIAEIRHSLSSLIENPNSILSAAQDDSDSDLEIENAPEDDGEDLSSGSQKEKENRNPFASRRTVAVVDRISLKRQSSSNVSAATRMAFSATGSGSGIGFKVPALLRRATTNSSITSTSSTVSATERTAGGFGGGDEQVRKKASKTSGIHFAARESERKSKVKEVERKREAKKFRGVDDRRKVVGGLFGKGSFT